MKFKYLLWAIIFFLTGIGFYLWQFVTETQQFGLNFFTSMLGVLITVFVIDQLIKKREEEFKRPQYFATYMDVSQFTQKAITFWSEISISTKSEEQDEKNIQDFFTKSVHTRIFDKIDFSSVLPTINNYINFADWISKDISGIQAHGNKILNRHSYNLDPQTFKDIHQLTESTLYSFLIQTPLLLQLRVSNSEITKNAKALIQNEELDAVLSLQNWCEKTYNSLKKFDQTLKNPPEYNPQRSRKWIVD
jgi:hypothetical protein